MVSFSAYSSALTSNKSVDLLSIGINIFSIFYSEGVNF